MLLLLLLLGATVRMCMCVCVCVCVCARTCVCMRQDVPVQFYRPPGETTQSVLTAEVPHAASMLLNQLKHQFE